MRSLKLTIVGLVYTVFFFLNACTEEPEPGPVLNAPVLVSSNPENGAMDIPASDITLVLTFDQNVFAPSIMHSKVSLEGATINKISAYLKEVSIEVSGLENGLDYELVIPKGVVLGPTKVEAPEARIRFTTKAPVDDRIAATLSVKNPSQQAVNVYNFLRENYGEKVLSSTMSNVSWNINEAEWVKQHTGKYPAMVNFDYLHLPFSPANWIDYTETGFIESWWDNNGLIGASWHWMVPKTEGSSDITYKPNETTFKASNVLIDGTWENELAKTDLQKMAGYLKLLKDKNIPVIWRPLHEAAGNTYEYDNGKAWFWWGYGGANTYVKLWRYMFDYFEAQGLNNLIWVWTTQTKDDPYYPGDDYVDIIGRDIYNNGSADAIETQFADIQSTYPNKLVTLSEFGNVAKISDQWEAGAKWSYFMPWYDYDRTLKIGDSNFSGTAHEFANVNWWKDAMEQNYVLSRDEMPSLK